MTAEEEKDPNGVPEEETPSDGEDTPEAEEPESPDTDEEAEAEDKIPMTVSVEDEGPCRKKVKIEIASERVDEDIRKGIQDIKTSVPMRGFRKGRVPTMLLARRFGKKVKEEVRATLVSESIGQAFEQKGIRPFSMPEFSDSALEEIVLDEGKPLVLEFSVDVKPDISVDNYMGIEVERPKVELEKDEVDKELDRIRQSRGRVAPVEGGKVEHGDVLVVTRIYTYRKKTVHKEENATLPIP